MKLYIIKENSFKSSYMNVIIDYNFKLFTYKKESAIDKNFWPSTLFFTGNEVLINNKFKRYYPFNIIIIKKTKD